MAETATKRATTNRRSPRMPRGGPGAPAPVKDLTLETIEFKRIWVSGLTQRKINMYAASDGISIPVEYGKLILLGLKARDEENTNERK